MVPNVHTSQIWTQTSLIFLIINYLIVGGVLWTGFYPYLPMSERVKDSRVYC